MRHRAAVLLPLLFVVALFVPGAISAIAITVGILLTAVVVHEFGHLVVARLLGVRVTAFSIGFGPLLAHRTYRGVDWQLRLLPLGGFTAMHGEAVGSSTDSDSFTMAGRPRRAAILIAGILTNILVGAGILYFTVLVAIGFHFEQAGAASLQIAGMIFGETVGIIAAWLPHAASAPLDFPLVGVPGMAWSMSAIVAEGPVMVGLAAAIINISVGIMNLLPIPPTDGGHLMLDVLSDPQRGPTRVRRVGGMVGTVALVILAVGVTGLDIIRIALNHLPGMS